MCAKHCLPTIQAVQATGYELSRGYLLLAEATTAVMRSLPACITIAKGACDPTLLSCSAVLAAPGGVIPGILQVLLFLYAFEKNTLCSLAGFDVQQGVFGIFKCMTGVSACQYWLF